MSDHLNPLSRRARRVAAETNTRLGCDMRCTRCGTITNVARHPGPQLAACRCGGDRAFLLPPGARPAAPATT